MSVEVTDSGRDTSSKAATCNLGSGVGLPDLDDGISGLFSVAPRLSHSLSQSEHVHWSRLGVLDDWPVHWSRLGVLDDWPVYLIPMLILLE
jgi:hypothetical protein